MAESTPTQAATILIVDDNPEALFTLEKLLESNQYKVFSAQNGREALELIRSNNFDAVLSDVSMPEMDGFELAAALKGDPELRFIPVVLLTSLENNEDLLKGLDAGADDYIRKPYDSEELLARLHAVMRTRRIYQELQESQTENQQLRVKIAGRASYDKIIGQSAKMQEVYDLISRVAVSDAPVLIAGESGTGKELVASALHFASTRKDKPFIIQNCSAFSDHLLESELFGHVRGAFTGAHKDKTGLFEAAHKGTFFLDELGEMSQAMQAKLLRVLQDGSYLPVGSTQVKKADVRILAATNRNLQEMMSEGNFREDLFYRLNVITIELPPLRERREDIPILAQHFIEERAKKNSESSTPISSEALGALSAYHWPGNIRELQNEIERMHLLAGSVPKFETSHLSAQLHGQTGNPETPVPSGPEPLKDAIARLEKIKIREVLDHCNGNKSETAKILGISRSNLIAKVKQYEIE